jgi:hypothetical protein
MGFYAGGANGRPYESGFGPGCKGICGTQRPTSSSRGGQGCLQTHGLSFLARGCIEGVEERIGEGWAVAEEAVRCILNALPSAQYLQTSITQSHYSLAHEPLSVLTPSSS